MLYEKIYETIPRRLLMRGLEIFFIAGLIGLGEWATAWVPALYVGIIEAVLKALREWKDRKKNT